MLGPSCTADPESYYVKNKHVPYWSHNGMLHTVQTPFLPHKLLTLKHVMSSVTGAKAKAWCL